LRSATFVICCTASHREFLADALNRRDSVLFLPYLKAEPAQFPGTFRPRSKMPVCLGFFGRLRKEKGVPVLLRIADWMGQNQFECRLHGDDCETLVPASLPKSIRWGGPYDAQTDLDRLMSEIDIVVIPSVGAEGLPIVLSEAISRGVPVVAFDGGGLKDMKCFHKGVLIVKEGEENLKGALLEMRDRLRDGSLSESLIHEYGNHLSNAKTLQWWASIIKR
jgi:glycosyltransferase involved in cell wall biosynthesis